MDSNIVYSAILNTHSLIGKLLIEDSDYFDYYSSYLLIDEINHHRNKILAKTGFTSQQFEEIISIIYDKIIFVENSLLSEDVLDNALMLTKDVDKDDALFVALSLLLNAKLWTGDKKLIKGLKAKNFNNAISTQELFEKYLELEKKIK